MTKPSKAKGHRRSPNTGTPGKVSTPRVFSTSVDAQGETKMVQSADYKTKWPTQATARVHPKGHLRRSTVEGFFTAYTLLVQARPQSHLPLFAWMADPPRSPRPAPTPKAPKGRPAPRNPAASRNHDPYQKLAQELEDFLNAHA